jgi:lipoate-protein ligase A
MNAGKKLRVLVSASSNPWFNLATEEWIYRELDPSHQTLFLWRNFDTVVIGRNQNPWSECNLPRMEADGVKLARRTTGGGAVFHDLGNTCFTFLSPRGEYDRAVNLSIVQRALKKFGVTAIASGRNDLTVETPDGPRKISGSAFREARDRSFHHGTLLLSADLGRLADYLTPNPKKIESKGRASVRARVANIAEFAPGIDHERLSPVLVAEFEAQYGLRASIEELDPERLGEIEPLRAKFDEFSSWDWRFGRAPQFTHHMSEYLSWGFVEVFADSEAGMITRAQVFSDSLDPEMIEIFALSLVGKTYGRLGVEGAVSLSIEQLPSRHSELTELGMWLKAQVEVD